MKLISREGIITDTGHKYKAEISLLSISIYDRNLKLAIYQ